MAKSSWQGTNATVWYVASFFFIIAAIAGFLNEQTMLALGSVVLALAFIAIAQDIKKKRIV